MRKVLIGVVVVALGAVGGYFGASMWAQTRAEREVETAFNSMRAAGMTATHGAVSFDLLKRRLVIDDVAVTTNAPGLSAAKAGRVTAVGLGQPAAGRVSADTLDIANFEIAGTFAGLSGAQVSYAAPKIEIVNFAGPAAPPRKIDGSAIDLLRGWLEQLADTTATSITIPTLKTSSHMAISGNAAKSAGEFQGTYSDFVLRDLRDRRIATSSIDRFSYTMSGVDGAAELGRMTGEVGRMTMLDLDLGAMLALFDAPETAKSTPYRQAYRQISVGPMKTGFEKGGQFQVESTLIEDLGFQGAKINLSSLMATAEMAQQIGPTPSPGQTRQFTDRIGDIYEGLRMGRFEMRGISFAVPPGGNVKLAAVNLRALENGRLDEFALEGLDIRVPQQEPIAIGRIALSGLQIAELLRLSGQVSELNGKLTPEQSLGMLKLVEGLSANRVSVPSKSTRGPINVEAFELSWGQFVGPLPTKARTKLKYSGPFAIGDNDQFLKLLTEAGLTALKVDFDMATGWTEASRTFAVTPFSIELADWFSAQAAVSAGNVTREIFSLDPATVMVQAMGVEIGPAELIVRDTGALDRMLAVFAKQQGMSVQDAREFVNIGLGAFAAPFAADHPELLPIVLAVRKFIEAPRGTLTLKVVPNGRVPVMQLVTASQTDPFAALALFKIEATTTR